MYLRGNYLENKLICVYCDKSNSEVPFNDEHVIPRSFGKFTDDNACEALISDRVCEICNNSFSSFELRHSRVSLDAFQRSQAKVKGRHAKRKRKQKDKAGSSPYLQGHDNKRPITIEGLHPDGYRVLMRDDPEEGIVELTSVQFEHSTTRELIAIDLTPELTMEVLRERLKAAGYKKDVTLRSFWRPHEAEWIKSLFKDQKTQINEPPKPYEFRARIEGGLRKEDFRSVAKIAFNYMMKFNAIGFTGHEACFTSVKQFIRHGLGNAGDFCALMKPCFPPIEHEARCHLLKLEVSRQNGVVVWIQLFASKDMACVIHRIYLGDYPFSIHMPDQYLGHCFRIIEGKADSGEIMLLAANAIFPPGLSD